MQESIEPKTAGEIQNDFLYKEPEKYTAEDLGYASTDDLWEELVKCAEAHRNQGVPEMCLVMQYAKDPLLATVIRRKFYAVPFLPDPRPEQSVWWYNTITDKCQFLWSLPTARLMALLSESLVVEEKYKRMKGWCDAWYEGRFWEHIRKESGLSMLSEYEILQTYGEKRSKAVDEDTFGFSSDALYLPEIRVKKLETKANIRNLELLENTLRKSQARDRQLHRQDFNSSIIAPND